MTLSDDSECRITHSLTISVDGKSRNGTLEIKWENMNSKLSKQVQSYQHSSNFQH